MRQECKHVLFSMICSITVMMICFCQKSKQEAAEIRTVDWSRTVETFVLGGHTHEVTSATYSEDGRFILSLSRDCTARIWNAESGNEMAVLRGHGKPLRCGVFIDGGDRVITFSDDRTIKMWNAKDGKEIRSVPIRFEEDVIFSADFSPDGSLLALGAVGRSFIYDVNTGECLNELAPSGHPGLRVGIMDIGFSADGTRIVAACYSQEVAVWSSESGHRLLNLHEHGQGCLTAAFSADMTRLASGSRDSTVILWDARLGIILKKIRMGWEVRSVLFSPDGSTLLVFESAPQGTTPRAALYDVASAKPLQLFQGVSTIERAAFSPTDPCFAVPFGKTVKVFRAQRLSKSRPKRFDMDDSAAIQSKLEGGNASAGRIKETVMQAVNGPNGAIRLKASRLLARMVSEQDGIPLLVETLQNKDGRIRKNGALALAEIGSPALSATPDLQKLLAKDPNAEVRTAAALALGCIAQAANRTLALDGLLRGLKDEDVRVRYHAAHALDKMKDKTAEVVSALTRVVLSDSSTGLRRQIAFNLGNDGMSSVGAMPRLIQGLSSNDERERWWACYTIWCINTNVGQAARGAVGALKKALFDPSNFRDKNGGPPRKYAIYAMGGIGPIVKRIDPTVVTLLQNIMKNDDDYYHRKAAAIALENILQVKGLRKTVRGYVKRSAN